MDIDDFLNKETGDTPKEATKTELQPVDEPPQSLGTGAIADLLSKQLELWNQLAQANDSYNESLQQEVSQINRSILSELRKLDADRLQAESTVRTEIARIKHLLSRRQYSEAQNHYSLAKEAFNTINDCFSFEKKKLNAELLSVYHEIQNHSDAQEQFSFQSNIARIHSLVNRVHTLLEHNQFSMAQAKYQEVLRLYFELPAVSLHKKTELGSVILSLYKAVTIHAQIQALQNKLLENKPAPTNRDPHKKHLVHSLLQKKLDSAKDHLKKGYYVEAKKDIDAILRLDQNNREAQLLLKQLPK